MPPVPPNHPRVLPLGQIAVHLTSKEMSCTILPQLGRKNLWENDGRSQSVILLARYATSVVLPKNQKWKISPLSTNSAIGCQAAALCPGDSIQPAAGIALCCQSREGQICQRPRPQWPWRSHLATSAANCCETKKVLQRMRCWCKHVGCGRISLGDLFLAIVASRRIRSAKDLTFMT